MKQIKFLLSLAVALLIVVPVLAQDAAWGVSGDASATYKLNFDAENAPYVDADGEYQDSETILKSTMDDVTMNVKFNAAGEISPYVKFQYDKADENRWWIGGSFTKGNFKGEANAKVDGTGEFDVDTMWVTYTMGAVEFKFDKGGELGTNDTFKVTYTLSDMLKVFVALSDADLQTTGDGTDTTWAAQAATGADMNDYNYSGYDAYMGTNFPFAVVGVNLTQGMLKANAKFGIAMVSVTDSAQFADTGVAFQEDIAGQGFNVLWLDADVTATLGEGMSVKVYGTWGQNLDTFANDSGVSDANKANEQAAFNYDGNGFNNATSLKAGVEAKAFNATVTAEYKSTMSGLALTVNEELDDLDAIDARVIADTKFVGTIAYDQKIGELTLTPKFEYTNNLADSNDEFHNEITYTEDYTLAAEVDMAFTLKASVSF